MSLNNGEYKQVCPLQNIINEKIYLLLWFYLVFVLFMSILVFFYRICTLFFEPFRFYLLYWGIQNSQVGYFIIHC